MFSVGFRTAPNSWRVAWSMDGLPGEVGPPMNSFQREPATELHTVDPRWLSSIIGPQLPDRPHHGRPNEQPEKHLPTPVYFTARFTVGSHTRPEEKQSATGHTARADGAVFSSSCLIVALKPVPLVLRLRPENLAKHHCAQDAASGEC